jgi:peptidoglycan/LPS O-acetylase OafA/YrhL
MNPSIEQIPSGAGKLEAEKIPPAKAHIPAVHSLRGIASTAVFFKHIFSPVFVPFPFLVAMFNNGQYGVHVFFMLSGFVLPYAMFQRNYHPRQFLEFLLKRLIRLEPPYVFAILVAVGYLYLAQHFTTAYAVRSLPSLRELVFHIGYLIPLFKDTAWVNQVFWTLAVEFQYYFVIGLLFPLLSCGKKIPRFIFYALFLLPTFLLHGQILNFLPLFLLGTVGCLWVLQKIDLKEMVFMMLVLAAANFTRYNVEVLLLIFASIGTIIFFPNLGGRLLTFLGNISYSLYLTHFATAMAFHNFFMPLVDGSFLKTVVFLVGMGLGFLFAYAFYLLIEKPAKQKAATFRFRALFWK